MNTCTSKPSQTTPQRTDRALWAIVALALALRLLYVLALAPEGFHGPDAPLYDRIAWRLITEGRYVAEDHLGGMSYATRPVLFPFVLAGIYAVFGRGFLAVRLFHCLLGALTCGVTYSLGREIGGRRTGAFAGIGAALFPQLIYYCGTLTTETLCVFLTTCGIYLAMRAYRREAGLWWWAAAGAMLGLAGLTRSAMLGLVPVVCLWLVVVAKRRRAALARAALMAAAAAAVISPWVIRNYAVLGEFVPATTEGGYTFWVTSNPKATGGGHCFLPDNMAPFFGLNEVEADRLFYRMGLRFARENPGRFVQLLGAKFVRFWRPWPHADEVGIGVAIVGGVSFVPVLLLAAAGVALAWDRRRELSLLYVQIGYTTVVYCVYMAVTRYRAPLMPALLVLASMAAVRITRADSWQS